MATATIEKKPKAMRRSGWKKAIRCLVFWTVMVFLLAGTSRLVSKHHDTGLGIEVLQDGDEIQVAFIGSSHVLNAISPQQIWQEQGIRAQTVASPGETLVCTYWHLRNALNYMHPDVVMVDLYGIIFEGKIYPNGDPRAWLDSVPFSRTKLETVLDLYGAKGLANIWPFTYEHTRWNDLTETDVEPVARDPMRGSGSGSNVVEQPPYMPVQGTGEVNELGLQYLQKILDACKEREIRPVAMILPYTITTAQTELNLEAAVSLAEQAGITVLDFRDMDVVNPTVDFQDYHHLNLSGMDKITRWIGAWLSEQGVQNQRDAMPELTEKWDESYATYRSIKRERIEMCEKLENLLVLLHDADYSCILSIPPDLHLWTDDSYAYVRALLENLGIELTGNENETGLYAVVDSRNAAFTVQYGPEPVQTDWGLVQWQDRTNGTDVNAPIFQVGEDAYTFYGETDPDRAANILIVENVTGNLIYQHIYSMSRNM